MTQTQKILSVVAHISYLFLGVGTVIVPLVLYLYYQDKDEFIANHSKQALGMQVFICLLGMVIGILCYILVGVLLLPIYFILLLIWFVCSVIGAWKAIKGEEYTYPIIGKTVAGF